MRKVFTLIELIVVIAIIAILAAIIAPNAFKAIEKAKITQAIADFKTFKNSLYAYYADCGKWPKGTDMGGGLYYIFNGDEGSFLYLMENTGNDFGWDGPYIEKYKLSPWETWYTIVNEEPGAINYGDVNPLGIDIVLSINDDPNNKGNPRSSIIKIDEKLDDGNLTTGNILEGTESTQLNMQLVEIGKW